MAYVNIPRYRNDPNYRYKMPRIQSRIEGRGNGTKTNISNMGDIARALKRPPTYTTKFFGCELGAMSKFEESEEKALINGAHNEQVLSIILDKFIDMYVLCSECQLPEIDLIVRKGVLCCSCNACGHKGFLDMTHKAASYMLKNPVNVQSNISKEEKRGGRSGSSGNIQLKKGTKAGKKRRDSDELLEEERLTVESQEVVEIAERLGYFLNSGSETNANGVAHNGTCLKPVDDFKEELHMLQLSQDFDNICRFYIALLAIFNDTVDCAKSVSVESFESKIDYIKASLGYKILPKEILLALAAYLYTRHPEEITNFPYYCQLLYTYDIIDAEDFHKFYVKSDRCSGVLSESYLKTKSIIQPFLTWLKED